MGGTDKGKTTLVTHLARRLASIKSVAIVDADIGQSHIGPPTTVGWSLAEVAMSDLSALPVRGMYFVGDITPTDHLLPLTVAIEQSCQHALREAQLVVVDTGGFINDPSAKALWWQVHRIVEPQVLIAVQSQDELEPILTGIEQMSKEAYRLSCPKGVRLKSASQRQKFREERFAQYFRRRNRYELNLEKVSVQMTRPHGKISTDDLEGHLIALRDSQGRDRALGIVIEWHNDSSTLVFTSPPIVVEEICCVVMGDIRISLSQF
ncbi:MAG: hypothetical protein KAS23_09230 [Anaerohalosphaera sp.]|nr:hypothetical protein [Anaerohalosphaera sp.]